MKEHRLSTKTPRSSSVAIYFLLLIAAMFTLSSCAPASGPVALSPLDDPNKIGHAPVQDEPKAPEGPANPLPPVTTEKPNLPALKICSELDFPESVIWPRSLSATDREALKLALNISGSYEGSTGWANLTNDFDGMGLSMGLLNQTLGTGSLQPMLIKAQTRFPEMLNRVMARGNLDKLLKMLATWQEAASGRNATSAKWARKTLYTQNGGFTSSWRRDLTALTTSSEYITIQIESAVKNHKLALSLARAISCTELRCYLLMYDFAVQNGGLYQEDLDEYDEYVEDHPQASMTTRLKKLIELRIRHVRDEYMNDVRARKTTIVNGQGKVHGEQRTLEKEFCFTRLTQYPQVPSTFATLD